MSETGTLSLLCEEWAAAFAAEANRGPDEARHNGIEENYWAWIDRRKQQMNLTLGLAVKSDEGIDSYAYFRMYQGEVVETWCDHGERRGEAELILGGSTQDWTELLTGSRNLSQNIMYRRLRLLQGNLHYFFRNIYFFVEFIRQGLRVPTQVPVHVTSTLAEAAPGA